MRATTAGASPSLSSSTARFRRLSNSAAVPLGLIPVFYTPASLGVSLKRSYAVGSFAVGKSPSSVAVRDLNNDQRLDLVTANVNTSDVSVLLGNGDGSFLPMQSIAVGARPQSVAVADINGDGQPDLVTANSGS